MAKALFPNFRSGEHKHGTHRPDLSADGRELKSIELPLVGGPAFMLAIVGSGLAIGYFLHFSSTQWTLLLLGLGAMSGLGFIGFIDDWHKVYRNEGISEYAKLFGVLSVSIAAGLFYFFLLPSGRESYGVYIDIFKNLVCTHPHSEQQPCPVVYGQIAYFGWLVLLTLTVGFIGTVTSLSVDFSDGLDGLAGGLVFTAALAFGIIVTGIIQKGNPAGIVLEVLSLLCAGAVLGYLPWNWPSSWGARPSRSMAKRRARIYMGDSGALGLGGILAIIAIFSRQEILLLMVGGAFVLEGLSALVSARLMTPFFRRKLQILRFANTDTFITHTEFPRPFLATPLHCHFDLLGWDRRVLVYSAWALGTMFAALGVMVGVAPATWQRYLGRILVLILALLVWSSGSWTKGYFIGTQPADQRKRRRRLALYYGFPYRLMGIKLYHLVEIIGASENVIETPAEELTLWQRMNIYDARAMLGLYCYRAGYLPAALAQWTRIPEKNRALRPVIAHLLDELDGHLSLLEKQETQPIRRDQIVQKPPAFSGNLSPADLPNPYEPIREEILDVRVGGWDAASLSTPPYTQLDAGHSGGASDPATIPTAPLEDKLMANGHDQFRWSRRNEQNVNES
jgi:UDP-N-acetylmuramyl pentapeptide phosphotransferase/UDP-N-acetylglucosamine-1-phosphate transferase